MIGDWTVSIDQFPRYSAEEVVEYLQRWMFIHIICYIYKEFTQR